MKTVKVGFDYDEPIFPWYDYAHEASIAAGLTEPDAPPPTVWDPHSVYGCTLEEWYAVLDAEIERGIHGMYGRPVHRQVVEDMRRMYERGYEIHIVTARGQFGSKGAQIKRLTKRQLIAEQIPYTSLTFSDNKAKVIRELGLDYFIDDRDRYYLEAQEAGAEPYLLDAGWNRDFEVPKDRRVYSTSEYIGKVMDIEQLTRPKSTPRVERYAGRYAGL